MSTAKSVAERFWEKVNKDGPVPSHAPELGPCWVWTGSRSLRGYGNFKIAGRSHAAHRIAWDLTFSGHDGLWVLHRCDNPSCVRTDHLFLGSNADNMADMVAKGRQARGDRHGFRLHPETVPRLFGDRNGARLHPESRAVGERHGSRTQPESVARGELHPRAKLSAGDVREIRQRYANGESQRRLSRLYGIHRTAVGKIVRRELWVHVVEGADKCPSV